MEGGYSALNAKISIEMIYMMRTAMIYAGFPMWWIMDDDNFDFGAVINGILVPSSSWRELYGLEYD